MGRRLVAVGAGWTGCEEGVGGGSGRPGGLAWWRWIAGGTGCEEVIGVGLVAWWRAELNRIFC